MNHPILLAALVEDRRRQCPCMAVAPESYGPCRRCRAAAIWRHETTWTSRSATPNQTHSRTAKAWLVARMASLLRIIGKGAES